jgi:CheY-like chemotaxis protein
MEGLKTDLLSQKTGLKREDYLPVLVLTAQPGHKLRALQAGAKDFISKPFDLVEVRTRIHNMLEVRVLYRKLADYNRVLEKAVRERTAELRASEARYVALTELASDWYWEQDASGQFIKTSGPVLEVLGIHMDAAAAQKDHSGKAAGWNEVERKKLQKIIAAREPFLDLVISCVRPNGSTQTYRVSGEPMFSDSARFIGYRGIGVELRQAARQTDQ